MHPSFKEAGEDPFGNGYGLIDPHIALKVAQDAKNIANRGLVQLCTYSDAWSPLTQQYNLGRNCLEAVLNEPGWSVRVLSKNAAVARDFDVIARHRERVVVGISMTAPAKGKGVIKVIEPNASLITERMDAMLKAHDLGLRTYAMLCPLLPGIAADLGAITELVDFAIYTGAEEIFAEPVNARGPALKHTQEALETAGFAEHALEIQRIRNRSNWGGYVVELAKNLQQVLRARGALSRLRFLLYQSQLTPADKAAIAQDPTGIIWL